MLFLRSLLFFILYNASGIIAGTFAVIMWPIVPYSLRWKIITLWNRLVMVLLRYCCNIRYQIIGQRRSDKFPCVIMSKHQSTWETMFLQFYFGPCSTILKKELLRIPFFGWGLATLRPIAINRSSPIQALKDVKIKGLKRIAEGNNVLLFPEGTRIPYGSVGNYARSGADIAVSAGVPIVAVAHNAGKLWPKTDFIKRPGTIYVSISDPIDTQGRDRKELTAEVKEWIETEIAKMPTYDA